MLNLKIAFFFIPFILLGKFLMNTLNSVIELLINLIDLNKKIILRNELYNLSPREFELWCGDFLKSNNYENVVVSPVGPDGGVDIKCTKNEVPIYVECKRYVLHKKASFKVDAAIVKKLLGAMTADKVFHGIIITTGIITEDALVFINTLPKSISIKYYDGSFFNTEADFF